MNIKTEASKNTGYLELFIGPMFSGKTSKVLEIYKQCNFCSIPVTIINHSIDTRYHNTMISTHDKVMAPCIQTTRLSDIWNYKDVEKNFDEDGYKHIKLRNSEVILINEGQFFEDLYDVVVDMLREKNSVKFWI
jgi:thymidine kinase